MSKPILPAGRGYHAMAGPLTQGERVAGFEQTDFGFKWEKTAIKVNPSGDGVNFINYPGYKMVTTVNQRDPGCRWYWAVYRTSSGITIIALNGVPFGKDKKSDIMKVTARVERIASALGHEAVK